MLSRGAQPHREKKRCCVRERMVSVMPEARGGGVIENEAT